MGVVLFYNEGLSSRLMFHRFLRENPRLFDAIVEFPTIPHARKSGKKNWRLIGRILQGSLWFPVMTGLAYSVYAPIARACGNDLRTLAQQEGIVYRRQAVPDAEFSSWLRDLSADFVFNGSSTILGRAILEAPRHGVVNYHGVSLPEYRGTANQFWLLANQERHFKPTLHFVDEGLDTGPVIHAGASIAIGQDASVFSVWRDMLLGAYPTLQSARTWLASSERPNSMPQDPSKAATRSFPLPADIRGIRRLGHPIMTLGDVIYILRVAVTGRH